LGSDKQACNEAKEIFLKENKFHFVLDNFPKIWKVHGLLHQIRHLAVDIPRVSDILWFAKDMSDMVALQLDILSIQFMIHLEYVAIESLRNTFLTDLHMFELVVIEM
jgi:hypothetical protein